MLCVALLCTHYPAGTSHHHRQPIKTLPLSPQLKGRLPKIKQIGFYHARETMDAFTLPSGRQECEDEMKKGSDENGQEEEYWEDRIVDGDSDGETEIAYSGEVKGKDVAFIVISEC